MEHEAANKVEPLTKDVMMLLFAMEERLARLELALGKDSEGFVDIDDYMDYLATKKEKDALALREPKVIMSMSDLDSLSSSSEVEYDNHSSDEEEVTVQDLEMTRQGAKESLPKFIARWRGKAALMADRLSEKEQLRLLIKCLQPCYYNNMFNTVIRSFEDLIQNGKNVLEALQNGVINKSDGRPKAWG